MRAHASLIVALAVGVGLAPLSSSDVNGDDRTANPKPSMSGAERCTAIEKENFRKLHFGEALKEGWVDERKPDVRIKFTELNDSGSFGTTLTDLPTFCRVVGVIADEIGFEVWLPVETWNGKYHGVGIGGFAGRITYNTSHQSLPGLGDAVKRGYAAAATDMGHTNAQNGASGVDWAMGRPDRIRNFLVDGVHQTAVVAKAVVESFYGKDPKYSTFAGCSGGGHQALIEATWYPQDYDAIVAMAPVNPQLAVTWIEQASIAAHRDPAATLSEEEVDRVWDTIMQRTDGNDGLVDNSIEDPRRSDFKPADLLQTPDNPAGFLTAAQVEALETYYLPLMNSKGSTFFAGTGLNYFAGQSPGTGPTTLVSSGPEPHPFMTAFMRMYTQDPNWDWRTFDTELIEDIVANQSDMEWTSDFEPFRERGGKLILAQGWADWGATPETMIAFYKKVLGAELGGQVVDDRIDPEASSFMRLYMAPNTSHCRIGIRGGSEFDALAAVDRWRGTGEAPKRIISTRVMSDDVIRTRPLCPFPQQAIYKGTGSINRASNFSCGVWTGGRG